MPAKSSSPEVRAASFVVGSSTTTTMNRSTAGRGSPDGKSSFRSKTQRRFGSCATKRKGPFPTGCSLNAACRSAAGGTVSSRCAGRTARSVSTSGNASAASVKRRTTVESSPASTAWTFASSLRRGYPATGSSAVLSVQTTSRDVVGAPSCQATSVLSWKVRVFRSGAHCQSRARYGRGTSDESYWASVRNST